MACNNVSFKLCEREKGVEKEDVYTQVIFNTSVVQALPPLDKSWEKNPREKASRPLYNTPPHPATSLW